MPVAPKPEPDVCLAACAALGATPTLSIAIDDSPFGASAARAPGMHVYGVPAHGTSVDADVVVSSLRHISPDDLVVMSEPDLTTGSLIHTKGHESPPKRR